MANELAQILNVPKLQSEDISFAVMDVNKKTGERFARMKTNDGKTIIMSVSKSGVVQEKMITIPPQLTQEQRNQIIVELSDKFTQDEIAKIVDVSQSTVSNVLNAK